MLVHVVINRHVLALDEVVSIQFHLLAGNTRTSNNGILNLGSVGNGQFLHLVKALGLGSNGCIKDILGQLDIVGTVGHEVGFTFQGYDSGKTVLCLDQHTTV